MSLTSGNAAAVILFFLAGPHLRAQWDDVDGWAARFLELFREGDEEGMTALALKFGPDKYIAADRLFDRHVQGASRDPPDPEDFLAAAERLAAFAARSKSERGLPELVRAWRALDASALARETRLRDAVRRMARAQDPERTLAIGDEVARDLEAAPASLSPFFVHWHRSKALYRAGRNDASLEAIEAAGRAAIAVGSPYLAGMCLRIAGETQRGAGRGRDAAATFGRGLAILEPLGMKDREGELHCAIGDALREAGDFDEALSSFERARAAVRGQERRPVSAQVAAKACVGLGLYDEAADLMEKALAAVEATGDGSYAGTALMLLAETAQKAGRFDLAIRYLERVRSKGRPVPTDALRMLGTAYGNVGRFDHAFECLREALGRRPPRDIGTVRTLHFMGAILGELGRDAEAVEHWERSRQLALAIKDPFGVAAALTSHGSLRFLRGDPEEALKLLETALAGAAEAGSASQILWIRSRIACVLAARGKDAEAFRLLEETRRGLRESGQRIETILVLSDLARLRLERGASGAALAAVQDAIREGIGLLRGLDVEITPLFQDKGRDLCDLGLRAIAGLLPATDPTARPALVAEAFRIAELGRAMGLSRAIGGGRPHLEADLPPRLRQEQAWSWERVQACHRAVLERRTPPGTPPAEAAGPVNALTAAWRAYEDVCARIRSGFSGAAAAADPEPIPLDRCRESLAGDEAQILYQAAGPKLLAVVVRRDAAHLVDLGDADAALEAAEAHLDALSARISEEAIAARLHDLLLAPLLPHLDGAARLVISPDGVLSFLPFEALLGGEDGTRRRAIERWEISYLPSLSLAAGLRSRHAGAGPRGERFVALADPALPEDAAPESSDLRTRVPPVLWNLEGLGPLKASAVEARAISELFPERHRTLLQGAEATLDRLRAALAPEAGRLFAIHFACHGLVDLKHPRLSGLVLAGREVLSLEEITRLRIDADLAVLSACETARGRILRGEGVVGLVRGFLLAGAPRVVVSLGRVEDVAAKDLMVRFYAHLIRDGMPPAAALRRSKLDILGSGESHPARWAAFVLWGLPDW